MEEKMNINKTLDGNKLCLTLDGRLDTNTAPALETELKESLGGVSELVIDIEDLAYISSAGLRVLLSAQKTMNKQGTMVVKNVNAEIMEIFEITGFTDILNLQ